MWKKVFSKIWEKIKNFFKYIWTECKDWRTVALLAVVVTVVYSPVWVGYLLYFIFRWPWCLAVSTAVAAFWAGPFTPFFPLCITITFAIKKLMRVKKKHDSVKNGEAEEKKPALNESPLKEEQTYAPSGEEQKDAQTPPADPSEKE